MTTANSVRGVDHTFASQIDAVRIFSQTLAQRADEHDQAAAIELFRKGLAVLGVSDEAAGTIVGMLDPKELLSDPPREPKDKPAANEEAAKFVISQLERNAAANPALLRQLAEFVYSVRRASSKQGTLLRQAALSTLVIYFEQLLSALISTYYSKFPSALPEESNVLTLKELRQFASIGDAEVYVIGLETEAVLREGFEKQIKYLTSKLKLTLEPLSKELEQVEEITQRRNLLVHCAGRVNRIYLSKVKPDLVDGFGLKEGLDATVDDVYLQAAIDSVSLLGAFLIQQCWRRWDKAEVAVADNALCSYSYRALVDARYSMPIAFSNCVGDLFGVSDQTTRILLVNKAVALKEQGRLQDSKTSIASRDWTAASLRFRIAIAGVLDDFDTALELIPKVIAAGELQYHELLEWPALRSVRESPRFSEVIAKLRPQGT